MNMPTLRELKELSINKSAKLLIYIGDYASTGSLYAFAVMIKKDGEKTYYISCSGDVAQDYNLMAECVENSSDYFLVRRFFTEDIKDFIN